MLLRSTFWLTFLIILVLFVCLVQHQNRYIESFTFCGRLNLNRRSIWTKTKDRYGDHTASKIMPRTFLLPKELRGLINDPNKQFILKTMWSGQRRGVKLYDCKNNIQRDQHKYSVGQVYIKDPLLINGFKFDVRFFLVVYCGVGIFLYQPGYCVYTYKKYDYQSLDREKKINQVNTNESHYDINKLPRVFSDINKVYPNFNYKLVMQRLYRNLRMILSASNKMCCLPQTKGTLYHVFGVDVEVTKDLEPLILEINSDPTLTFTEGWKKGLLNPMIANIKTKNFSSPRWVQIKGVKLS